MKDVRDFSIGSLAAESDIKDGLYNYFYESYIYRQVEQGHANILIGNRGSGKSAILKMLAKRESDKSSIVIEITPEEYSYEIFKATCERDSPETWAKLHAYNTSWRYALYVIIIKKLTEQCKQKKINNNDTKLLTSFLSQTLNESQTNIFETLLSYLRNFGTKRNTNELHKLYRLESIDNLIQPIKNLTKNFSVIILIDELDRGWDASIDAKQFIAGLFQASIILNNTFDNIRIIISMRRELYDNIPDIYDDAQKVRDQIIYIEWNADELLYLIAQRIEYSLNKILKKNFFRRLRNNMEYAF